MASCPLAGCKLDAAVNLSDLFDAQRGIGWPAVDHPGLLGRVDSFSEIYQPRSQHAQHRRKHEDRSKVAVLAVSAPDVKTLGLSSSEGCGPIRRRQSWFRSKTLTHMSAAWGRAGRGQALRICGSIEGRRGRDTDCTAVNG